MSLPAPPLDPSSASRLRVSPEKLISAAGGLDALVDEFWTQHPKQVDPSVDSGHTDFSAAVSEFLEAWSTGLYVLLRDQRTTAEGLRRAATEVLGIDVDVAYAFRSTGYTVDSM